MALPKPHAVWPPEHPLRIQQKNFMIRYSGQNPLNAVKVENRISPDPAGARPTSSLEAKNVYSNIVADIAGIHSQLLFGETPRLVVNEDSKVNSLVTAEQADEAQTAVTALVEQTESWSVFRTAAELASVTGESYVRVIADPRYLPLPILQAVPSTYVDATWQHDQLISARMWTEVGKQGTNVLRWVEERDNGARVIRNGLYLGTDINIGQPVPLSSHPTTAGLVEEQEYLPGVTEMVWHLRNATPSRVAPESPHGRSDFEGAESLIASLDLVYTSWARDLRLSQARLIVPTASLTRGLNGGAVWENSREIITDLDLDPSNPSSRLELVQPDIRHAEFLGSANGLIARIVESVGFSPKSVGLGEYGAISSGVALRVMESRTINKINSQRSNWGPIIGRIIYTQAKLARLVYGYDIADVVPIPAFPDQITPDPEVTARQIQLLSVAGAASTETIVKMAQPHLSAAEVQAEVERIYAEKERGVSPATKNGEPAVAADSDMVTIAPDNKR